MSHSVSRASVRKSARSFLGKDDHTMAAAIRIPGASPPDKEKPAIEAAEAQPGDGEAVEKDEEQEQSAPVDWRELVTRIQRGDESGMEDLYLLFARGIRFYLCRQLGVQELDDTVT